MKITAGLPFLAAALAVLQTDAASLRRPVVALSDFQEVETTYVDLRSSSSNGRVTTAEEPSSSYRVTKLKGRLTGIEVSVSGKGAWALLQGTMTTSSLVLDKSTEYEKMRSKYNIEAGIGGFYAFLAGGVKTNAEREHVKETMKEVSNQIASNATVDVDLRASGYAPNGKLSIQVVSTRNTNPIHLKSGSRHRHTSQHFKSRMTPGTNSQFYLMETLSKTSSLVMPARTA